MRSYNTFFSFFVVASLATASEAHADIVDDQLAKAEKAVATAAKGLEKAKACAAIHEQCLADMKAKAQKRLDNAQKAMQKFAQN